MADILTTVFGFVKQTIGGNRNTWGGILNNNFDAVEAAIVGEFGKVVTGGSYTLTDSERRNGILIFGGVLASDQTIVVANLTGKWTVQNVTTGAFQLLMKTPSGTAVPVPQGGFSQVWCDGLDTINVGPSTRLLTVQMIAPDGTVAKPGYSFAQELASGLRRVSANLLALVINGVDLITFSATAITFNQPISATGLTVNGERVVPVGVQVAHAGLVAPPGWLLEYGQAVSRTTYAELMSKIALTVASVATASGSPLLSTPLDCRGFGLEGAQIDGSGIQSGTTIVSITATVITMSLAATGSAFITLRIFPYGNGDGATTFNIPDKRDRASFGFSGMGNALANRISATYWGSAIRLGGVGGSDRHTITAAESAVLTYTSTVFESPHTHSYQPANPSSAAVVIGAATAGGVYPGPGVVSSTTTGLIVGTTGNAGGGTMSIMNPGQIDNWIIFTGVF